MSIFVSYRVPCTNWVTGRLIKEARFLSRFTIPQTHPMCRTSTAVLLYK